MANVNNINVDRIKSLAKQRGMTMAYINEYLGKYRGFLSSVRCGTDHIDEAELSIIARLLDTTPEYLTNQTDDSAPYRIQDKACLNALMNIAKELTVPQVRIIIRLADLLRDDAIWCNRAIHEEALTPEHMELFMLSLGMSDDEIEPVRRMIISDNWEEKLDLIRRVQAMSDEEVRRVADIVDFVLAKREK